MIKTKRYQKTVIKITLRAMKLINAKEKNNSWLSRLKKMKIFFASRN